MAERTAYDVREKHSGAVLGLRLKTKAAAVDEARRLNADVAEHNKRVGDQVEENQRRQAEWERDRAADDPHIAPDLVEVEPLSLHQGEPLHYEAVPVVVPVPEKDEHA